MKNCTTKLILILFLSFRYSLTAAQTTVNPDISLIGDFRARVHDDPAYPDESEKLQLDFHELEIAATGYLNPFARADVFIGIHGTEGPVEIEEAYLTLLRGLPLNLQLKAGQYLADFGKINTQHPHQWSWISRPLMHQEMFGDDGLKDVGFNLSTLVPVGSSALTLSASVLKNGGLGAHHHDEVAEPEEPAGRKNLALLGRLSLFAPLSDVTSLDVGVSYLRAEFDVEEHRYADLGNFDFKLKWRPDQYRSLTLNGELLVNTRQVDADSETATEDVRSYGAFAALDYQFLKRCLTQISLFPTRINSGARMLIKSFLSGGMDHSMPPSQERSWCGP